MRMHIVWKSKRDNQVQFRLASDTANNFYILQQYGEPVRPHTCLHTSQTRKRRSKAVVPCQNKTLKFFKVILFNFRRGSMLK